MPIFADVFGEFVARAPDPRLAAVGARLRTPVAVGVRGRRGMGRDTVAGALAASGVRVIGVGERPEVLVVVVAESLKPEDLFLLNADVPTVVVLNKADLSGRVPGGPLAAAGRVAAGMAAAVGRPVVPMIAHLATVDLDAEMVAALHMLAETPADMTSVDAFAASPHPVPERVRRRMLAELDRFGIAHAVLAVAGGADTATVVGTLRELSQTAAVLERLARAAPEVSYRRVCAALDDLHSIAVASRDDSLAEFLSCDDVVVAVMAAAVDVMAAAGLRVDDGDDADAHVRRAVRWRRYADGPLDAVHRRCAADIARGSLRLLGRAERRGMDIGRAERRGMDIGRAERRGTNPGRPR